MKITLIQNVVHIRVKSLSDRAWKNLPLFLSLISSPLIEHIESAFCKLIKIDFPHFPFSLLLCFSVWKLCSEDIFSSPSTASFIIIFFPLYTHTEHCYSYFFLSFSTLFYPYKSDDEHRTIHYGSFFHNDFSSRSLSLSFKIFRRCCCSRKNNGGVEMYTFSCLCVRRRNFFSFFSSSCSFSASHS